MPLPSRSARTHTGTFEDRAAAASKAGLKALIVYNSIEGIYRNRSHAEDQYDYECANGKSATSKSAKTFAADKADGFRSSACAQDAKCASGRCLVTGTGAGDMVDVCCAWDT